MRPVLVAALAAALAGCASAPPAPPAPAPAFDDGAAIAAVRAAGEPLPTELDLQPLQDPQVADLRELATREVQAGRLVEAGAALDRALAERPDDPALLQARAEVALLARRPDDAFDLARRSHAGGPAVGPLCRRALETLVQVERFRASVGDAEASARIAQFERERAACTVQPPPRY